MRLPLPAATTVFARIAATAETVRAYAGVVVDAFDAAAQVAEDRRHGLRVDRRLDQIEAEVAELHVAARQALKADAVMARVTGGRFQPPTQRGHLSLVTEAGETA
jgi:hypothetical protein